MLQTWLACLYNLCLWVLFQNLNYGWSRADTCFHSRCAVWYTEIRHSQVIRWKKYSLMKFKIYSLCLEFWFLYQNTVQNIPNLKGYLKNLSSHSLYKNELIYTNDEVRLSVIYMQGPLRKIIKFDVQLGHMYNVNIKNPL